MQQCLIQFNSTCTFWSQVETVVPSLKIIGLCLYQYRTYYLLLAACLSLSLLVMYAIESGKIVASLVSQFMVSSAGQEHVSYFYILYHCLGSVHNSEIFSQATTSLTLCTSFCAVAVVKAFLVLQDLKFLHARHMKGVNFNCCILLQR